MAFLQTTTGNRALRTTALSCFSVEPPKSTLTLSPTLQQSQNKDSESYTDRDGSFDSASEVEEVKPKRELTTSDSSDRLQTLVGIIEQQSINLAALIELVTRQNEKLEQQAAQLEQQAERLDLVATLVSNIAPSSGLPISSSSSLATSSITRIVRPILSPMSSPVSSPVLTATPTLSRQVATVTEENDSTPVTDENDI